ncbi:unnamed protein product [Mycena citricolor]|nr:unnamed protein product [Mycena citricolor]
MPFNLPGALVPFQILFNPRVILPNLAIKDIRHLDFAALKEAGYRGIVFDKDNCITVPHKDNLVPELTEAWEDCRRTFGDGNVLIVSNSAGSHSDPAGIEAESVKRNLQVPVLFHATPKPGYSCVKAIRTYFSSLRDPVRPEQLVIVGDRIFTDVVLSNRIRLSERGSGFLHMWFRCAYERGGATVKENLDTAHRSIDSGPLSVWTTGVWKKEATFMRWCERKLVEFVRRRTSPEEGHDASSPSIFIKTVAEQPALPASRLRKVWQFLSRT